MSAVTSHTSAIQSALDRYSLDVRVRLLDLFLAGCVLLNGKFIDRQGAEVDTNYVPRDRVPMIFPGGLVKKSGVHRGVLVVAQDYPDLLAQPTPLAPWADAFKSGRDAASYAALIAAVAAPLVVVDAPIVEVRAANEAVGAALLDVASVIGRGHSCRPFVCKTVQERGSVDELDHDEVDDDRE
jgi:hypothetical protein